jgi:hypothetical protein
MFMFLLRDDQWWFKSQNRDFQASTICQICRIGYLRRLPQIPTVCNYTYTMPSSKAPKKLSPEQKHIAELEKQIAHQNKTIGALLFLHR